MFSAEYFLPIDAYIVVDAVGDSNIVTPPDSFFWVRRGELL